MMTDSFVNPSSIGISDVLLGRSRLAFNNFGNKRFRELILDNAERYSASTSKAAKTDAISGIIDQIHLNGGRFLRLVEMRGEQWEEVNSKVAKEKVGHALRDASSSKQRREEERRRAKRYQKEYDTTERCCIDSIDWSGQQKQDAGMTHFEEKTWTTTPPHDTGRNHCCQDQVLPGRAPYSPRLVLDNGIQDLLQLRMKIQANSLHLQQQEQILLQRYRNGASNTPTRVTPPGGGMTDRGQDCGRYSLCPLQSNLASNRFHLVSPSGRNDGEEKELPFSPPVLDRDNVTSTTTNTTASMGGTSILDALFEGQVLEEEDSSHSGFIEKQIRSLKRALEICEEDDEEEFNKQPLSLEVSRAMLENLGDEGQMGWLCPELDNF
jgi:hypothetical protein